MRNFLYTLFFLTVWILLFTGCQSDLKTDSNTQSNDKYLVSYTLIKSATLDEVKTLYGPLQVLNPGMADILPAVKYGFKVYSVKYNTTFGSKNVVASGLVCIPDGGGTYPLLSFQNTTTTLYADAPSVNPGGYTALMISGFASTGFVTLLPDYLGFGSSTEVFHPYLHKESAVTCLLDFFRAVKEMGGKSDLQLKLSSDLYLMGYSQGGLSSLQLDQAIESSYSGEFNLKAVGCGAALFNLTQIIDMAVSASTYTQPYYLAYIIKGFESAAAFSHPYTDIFNEPYASRIDPLFNGLNSSSAINSQLTTNMAQLFTNEFRTTWNTAAKYKDIRDALTASSVTAWRIKTPLVLTHGLADLNVPAATTQQFYDDLMKLDPSLPVTYIPLDGMNHELAVSPSMLIFMKKFLAIKGN